MTLLAWILVGLATLVLVLTPVRLRAARGRAGMVEFSGWVLNLHSIALVVALALIVLRLLGVHESGAATWAAIAGLVIASLIGLSFLARWRRPRSRHAVGFDGDGWTSGPWLSQLAHIGLTLGTFVFAWLLLADKI